MPRVSFSNDFDFRPNSRSVIAYKAGTEKPVTQKCADQAVAAGKGVVVLDAQPPADNFTPQMADAAIAAAFAPPEPSKGADAGGG